MRVDFSPKSSRISVQLSADQTLVNNTWTKVQCDTVHYDNLGEWSTSNYRFTAKNAGYYSVHGAVEFIIGIDQKIISTSIYKNGTFKFRTAGQTSAGNDQGLTSGGDVYLDVDDYIELFASHVAGVNKDIDGSTSSDITHLTIHRFA